MFIDSDGLVTWTKYVFVSEIAAVSNAVKRAHSDSRSWFNEFAGIIYKKDNCFAYDYNFIEGDRGPLSISPGIIQDGGVAVAGWHTHPRWNRIDGVFFSPEDRKWARTTGLPLWLGTPGGRLRRTWG